MAEGTCACVCSRERARAAAELQKAEVDPFAGTRSVVFRADFDWTKLQKVIESEPSTPEEVEAIGRKITEILERRKHDLIALNTEVKETGSGGSSSAAAGEATEADKVAFAEKALDETAIYQAKQQSAQERSAIGVDVMGNRVL